MNRPTALLVVAWLWIIIGILTIAGGGFVAFQSIVIHNILDELDVKNPTAERMGVDAPLFIMSIAYIIVFVSFAVGVFAVISGFFLLKLRNWARLSLEILSWLWLILMIFTLIIWVRNFTFFKSEGIAFANIIATLIWMIPFIASIILLRRKTVREAVKRRDTLATSSDGGIK